MALHCLLPRLYNGFFRGTSTQPFKVPRFPSFSVTSAWNLCLRSTDQYHIRGRRRKRRRREWLRRDEERRRGIRKERGMGKALVRMWTEQKGPQVGVCLWRQGEEKVRGSETGGGGLRKERDGEGRGGRRGVEDDKESSEDAHMTGERERGRVWGK